ncbi:MAG TPA: hypothetical protein VKM94_01100 [Blastocatellia bacterium]|nr:hypothetical protein [Blastocatellia bacterium]
MKRAALSLVVLLVLVAGVRAQKNIDQILVLVNDDPITRTDLLWSLAMDAKAPNPAAAVSSDVLRRKLDVMIDERLISQEASRIPSVEVTEEELRKKRSDLIATFKSEAAFRERVGAVGLTTERIDDLLRQRILIDRFIDFRFQTFVLVTEPDIQRYYDERLVPQLRASGQVPPALDKVRDRISAILKVEKVNQEIDRWLDGARQRAEVVVLAEP